MSTTLERKNILQTTGHDAQLEASSTLVGFKNNLAPAKLSGFVLESKLETQIFKGNSGTISIPCKKLCPLQTLVYLGFTNWWKAHIQLNALKEKTMREFQTSLECKQPRFKMIVFHLVSTFENQWCFYYLCFARWSVTKIWRQST